MATQLDIARENLIQAVDMLAEVCDIHADALTISDALKRDIQGIEWVESEAVRMLEANGGIAYPYIAFAADNDNEAFIDLSTGFVYGSIEEVYYDAIKRKNVDYSIGCAGEPGDDVWEMVDNARNIWNAEGEIEEDDSGEWRRCYDDDEIMCYPDLNGLYYHENGTPLINL